MFYRKAEVKAFKTFLNLSLRSVTRNNKEKITEVIKQELLTSIIEIADEEDYLGLNEEAKNAKSFSEEKTKKS